MADVLQPKALVQLVGSGGVTKVEEEWMRLVESSKTAPAKLADYQPVLLELAGRGKKSEAEALAWAAVETLSQRHSAQDVLPAAGAFLLALGDSEEFRKQVAELYRQAYPDYEGLEDLLTEAGLAAGRPVRRALRTLDVSLAVEEGAFLVSRESDQAAQVKRVDRETWQFTITTSGRTQTLGAVHLADQWQPASSDDFRVMRQFEPQRLRQRLEDDPAGVLVDLCRQNANSIGSEALAELLAPDLVPPEDWKRWWGKARSALKKSPHLRLEGRSPYTVVYDDTPVDFTSEFVDQFRRHRDPVRRFDFVEKYIRECSVRGESSDRAILLEWHRVLRDQARDAIRAKDAAAALIAAASWQVGEMADVAGAQAELFDLMAESSAPAPLMAPIRRQDLLERAVKALIETRPQSGRDELLAMLPNLPQSYCDRAVEWLMQGGCTRTELDPAVQRILAAPVAHFDALLWLWDGPAYGELVQNIPPLTILMRILRTLTDARLSDEISKEQARTMCQHARSALSARNFERFEGALQGIDSGMAAALRNQINHVDGLGRPVQDGLLNRVSPHLPKREAGPVVLPWDREDIIYTTETGLSRKQNEIEHHVNVKMRENAIAIGAAAEKGDLSENSEYKFALEERDLLRARLAQMNSEYHVARVLSPDEVPTDYVGIGTRVVFRRQSDGQPYELTFVGPWESDHDKRRINYKAPLAKLVLGKRPGDTVEFDHTGASGTYEIVALHNGLREMAMHETG